MDSLLRAAFGTLAGAFRSAADRQARRLERSEARLLRLVSQLGILKGVFVKAGQFASLRLDLLPARAQAALEALQQNVPPISFPEIRQQVERQLGGNLDSHFLNFEPIPLGSASIAQVHRARLLDSTPVAVKVQYPWIASSLRADLVVMRTALLLLAWVAGRRIPDRRLLFEEFARSLSEELDFEREARTAERIATNLAGDPTIVVPEIYPDHTAPGVLTMSYFKTLPLDRNALIEHGVEPRPVVEALARAYAKQVFVDGLFHADPHPGNLFVLDEPEASQKPRVLFVDFGLSKELDPVLRAAMRKGLYALIQRDAPAFVGHMEELGMIAPGADDGALRAVSSMFDRLRNARESNPGTPALGIDGSQVLGLKDEAKHLLRETPGLQLPTDLLLYAKTLSYLFALAERLDPDVDVLRIALPHVLRFLAEKD